MPFLKFMNSVAGRILRAVLGVAVIVLAIVLGGWWLLLLAPGALFLAAGMLDFCPLSLLAKQPLSGKKFRELNS